MKPERKSPEERETETIQIGRAIPPEIGIKDLKLRGREKWGIRALFPSFHYRRWVFGVGIGVLFLFGGGVVFSVYQARNEPPEILALTPNPYRSREIPPDFTAAALFSQPMDPASVEEGLFYYTVQPDGEMRGPFPLQGKGEFQWKNGGREVSFHLLPEFYPHPKEVYILEVRGLRGKNGKLLKPGVLKFRFTIGFPSASSEPPPTPEGWKGKMKMYRDWIESGGEIP